VGANPISILIPCHRVVRKNGDLGGYYWGLPLKKRLLQREGVGGEASYRATLYRLNGDVND
jgi:AraC family transcriptional regulator, regulatory protein of adaptative response / methylated-DNA-[protein]-cysteine methyltransferase